ncbi:hypothetical protein BaRGS_00012021 [Batillaria attramentaria]|uniref:Uncharacterized protein n=1 Tax=Batillaria attramentaria TaxID=370345 RepID=A0ABD0LCW7_9CAEN
MTVQNGRPSLMLLLSATKKSILSAFCRDVRFVQHLATGIGRKDGPHLFTRERFNTSIQRDAIVFQLTGDTCYQSRYKTFFRISGKPMGHCRKEGTSGRKREREGC